MANILIIDDEIEIRLALQRILERYGYSVRISDTVNQAMDFINGNHSIDLIISDILLPGLSGIDLLKYVSKFEKNIPVILVTGNPNLASAEEAIHHKAFDYISKPFQRNQILNLVKKALEQKFKIDEEKKLFQQSRQMEQALRVQNLDLNRQNAAIINATSDSVITVSETGIIISSNLSALETFGFESPLDFIGHPIEIIFSPDKTTKYRKEAEKIFLSKSENFNLFLNDVNLIRSNGSLLLADIAICNYKIDKDLFFTGIIRDVTQRKIMMDRLLDSERRAFLSTLAASIGHEINNSLTAMLGFLEMALKPEAQISIKDKALKVSLGQANKLQSLTSNLLHLGKAHRLKASDKSSIIIQNAIESVLEVFQTTTKLKYCRLIFNKECENSKISIDQDQFSLLLSNLLINAGDATNNHGQIEISVLKKRNKICMSIADDGIGMSEETLNQIFEPYFTTKELGNGTGLGLFVVKQISENNNIEIKIETQLGLGTKFNLIFDSIE